MKCQIKTSDCLKNYITNLNNIEYRASPAPISDIMKVLRGTKKKMNILQCSITEIRRRHGKYIILFMAFVIIYSSLMIGLNLRTTVVNIDREIHRRLTGD